MNGTILVKKICMKNQSIIAISILSACIGLAIGYAFWSGNLGMSDKISGQHRMPDGTMMSNDGSDMNTMGGMSHAMMMVKSEREFLEGMIPHHQEAVDTAKEVIARGGSTSEINKLAEDIVIAQEKEIAMMKEWYQSWYGTAYVANPEVYTPMMRDLSTLNGASLDKVFLEDMLMHHMGAVMMAQSVQPYIEHTEMTDLTKAIAETQTAEMQLMKRMLGSL
jgi:uncharacterized protein (DUF305 family)